MPTTPEDVSLIRRMRKSGMSVQAIAEEMLMERRTVEAVLRPAAADPNDRPRLVTAKDDEVAAAHVCARCHTSLPHPVAEFVGPKRPGVGGTAAAVPACPTFVPMTAAAAAAAVRLTPCPQCSRPLLPNEFAGHERQCPGPRPERETALEALADARAALRQMRDSGDERRVAVAVAAHDAREAERREVLDTQRRRFVAAKHATPQHQAVMADITERAHAALDAGEPIPAGPLGAARSTAPEDSPAGPPVGSAPGRASAEAV